jgi:large subunit ribosomal protein L35Ae
MEGTIVNYRRNSTGQTQNHLVVMVEGVDSRDKATKLVGKKVLYNTGKKSMEGKINAAHGNKGALRAVFTTGLPGQALGKKVKIE